MVCWEFDAKVIQVSLYLDLMPLDVQDQLVLVALQTVRHHSQ